MARCSSSTSVQDCRLSSTSVFLFCCNPSRRPACPHPAAAPWSSGENLARLRQPSSDPAAANHHCRRRPHPNPAHRPSPTARTGGAIAAGLTAPRPPPPPGFPASPCLPSKPGSGGAHRCQPSNPEPQPSNPGP
uniref:Uncharacterized protein n=1 Tax=Setaria viridis TaxID=4556 RepID=A0A4U6UQY3_SETVI|nr:hypothetical protein SEVIR_5G454350v2 [Setaria viridis]